MGAGRQLGGDVIVKSGKAALVPRRQWGAINEHVRCKTCAVKLQVQLFACKLRRHDDGLTIPGRTAIVTAAVCPVGGVVAMRQIYEQPALIVKINRLRVGELTG